MDPEHSMSVIESDTKLTNGSSQVLQYCHVIPDECEKNEIIYIKYESGNENNMFKLEDNNIGILKVSSTEQPFQNEEIVQEVLEEENKEELINVSNLEPVTLIDGTKAYLARNPPELIKTSEMPEGTVFLQDCTEILRTEIADGQYTEESIDTGKNLHQVQLEDGTFAIIELHMFNSANTDTATPEETEETDNSVTVFETKKPTKKDKLYLCTYEGCNKAYTTFNHLRVHDRSHTGVRPYKCIDPNCRKAFATSYSLKTHLRTHSGEKPYACTTCPKRFKTSGDLHKHTRIHTGERPFQCLMDGCNMSFTTSNIRNVHMRTHTGERPFQCSEAGCDKAFSSATNYKNHLRVHTGEKPYMCKEPNCGKRFTEYSSLYKHQLVHSQEKQNVCELCGKNYRQISTLRSHKRLVHGVKHGTDVILTDIEDPLKMDETLTNQDSPVQFTLLQTEDETQDAVKELDDESMEQIPIGRICYIDTSNLNL